MITSRERQVIDGLGIAKVNPQAHGSIIVAFHPGVFGYRSFIFSHGKAGLDLI